MKKNAKRLLRKPNKKEWISKPKELSEKNKSPGLCSPSLRLNRPKHKRTADQDIRSRWNSLGGSKRSNSQKHLRFIVTKGEPESQINLEWKKQLHYFNQIIGDLLKDPDYRGSYIAIKDYEIIDKGSDEFELYKRVKNKNPNAFFLVVKVEKGNEKYAIDTPIVKKAM